MYCPKYGTENKVHAWVGVIAGGLVSLLYLILIGLLVSLPGRS